MIDPRVAVEAGEARDEYIRKHARAEEERDAAIAERDELLAIIHRDGGHYVGEHGVTKAVADAHATWAAVVSERDRLRREAEALRRELAALRPHVHDDIVGHIDAILRGES